VGVKSGRSRFLTIVKLSSSTDTLFDSVNSSIGQDNLVPERKLSFCKGLSEALKPLLVISLVIFPDFDIKTGPFHNRS